jgi:hypothetical protein
MTIVKLPTDILLKLNAVLFLENFESPVVVGYDPQPPVPTGWLPANQGFKSSQHGLNNKTSGDWVATNQPDNNQAYAFKYTNTGLCTAEGVIGKFNSNTVTYRLTFDVGYDKCITPGDGNPSGAYRVYLCAFPDSLDPILRQTFNSFGHFETWELLQLTGSVADDNLLHTISAEYTSDPILDASWFGNDLAVAIVGATSSGVVDNIKVEVV